MPPKEQATYDQALRKIESCRRARGPGLNFRALGLTHLRPEIGQLANLEKISLDQNQLHSLPPEI